MLRGAETVLLALRGTFHLDPVPHLMRGFVPGRDADLRRTAENLSAAVVRLRERDPEAFGRLQDLVRQIADDGVEAIGSVSSELGDVMFTLEERRGHDATAERTPAREMSDGLLRFTAVATALLSSQQGLDVDATVGTTDPTGADLRGGVLVVVEELENGLHPSQAQRVLDLVRQAAAAPGTGVLVTTHSPALLDAAEGTLNHQVVVCHRAPGTGYSTLTPLTELPGYAVALARGSLGAAVTAGHLTDATEPPGDFGEFEQLLGIR